MTLPDTAGWWSAGEEFFRTSLAGIDDLDAPSLLPGWTRRVLVAHVARNADALVNLLTWAGTGVETPMYSSTAARDQAITEAAGQPASALLADVHSSADRLEAAVHQLPQSAWSASVRTAQGRTVAASEVLWMRCREVWVHAVDLGEVPFDQVPDEVLGALLNDVTSMWERRGESPDVTLRSPTGRWGSGTTAVSGPLAALTAYASGRSSEGVSTDVGSALPTLPRWL